MTKKFDIMKDLNNVGVEFWADCIKDIPDAMLPEKDRELKKWAAHCNQLQKKAQKKQADQVDQWFKSMGIDSKKVVNNFFGI